MADGPSRDGGPVESLRRLPADVVAVLALLVLADLAALAIGSDAGPLTFVLVLPLLTFLPGYAVIAAMYPEGRPDRGPDLDDATADASTDEPFPREDIAADPSIDGFERLTLSIGVSIAIVPMLAYATVLAMGRLQMVPVLVGTTLLTVVALTIAVWRRRRLPPDRRFTVSYRPWVAAGRRSLLEPTDRVDLLLNVALVATVLLAAMVFAYTLTAPKPNDDHTEFYVMTESDNGTLVADGYPTNFVRGEGQPLIVGLTNQEHDTREYTVVAVIQRVSVTEKAIRVRESRELRRFSTTLAHNETWRESHEIAPTLTGERLRLAYLRYDGEAPANPTFANADDQVFLWVNVTEPGSGG